MRLVSAPRLTLRAKREIAEKWRVRMEKKRRNGEAIEETNRSE